MAACRDDIRAGLAVLSSVLLLAICLALVCVGCSGRDSGSSVVFGIGTNGLTGYVSMSRKSISGEDMACDLYIRNTAEEAVGFVLTNVQLGVVRVGESYGEAKAIGYTWGIRPQVEDGSVSTNTVLLCSGETRKVLGLVVKGNRFVEYPKRPKDACAAAEAQCPCDLDIATVGSLSPGKYHLLAWVSVDVAGSGGLVLHAESDVFRVVGVSWFSREKRK